MTAKNAPSRKACDEILERVASETGLPVQEIVFSLRDAPSRARFAVWRSIVAETGCSIHGLAATWGVDNSTVRNGLRLNRVPA